MPATPAPDPLAQWWVHDVVVEPLAGGGAEGTTYADGVTLRGFVEQKRRLVRAPTGEQVVSESTLYLPREAVNLPAGSRVTLPDFLGGGTTVVLAFSRHDAGDQPTPNHVEVSLA